MSQNVINIAIALVTALASIVAAFIYYLTLKELRKQRENTSRPHLFIDKASFNVQGVRHESYLLPMVWNSGFKNSILQYSQDIKIAQFYLKCFNIGIGAATNIEIEFSYDIDNFLAKILMLEKEMPESDVVTIKRNNAFISFSPGNEKMPSRSFSLAIEGHLKRYISYILPVHIKNESVEIPLPSHYLELLNVYVYYFMTIVNKQNLDYSIPPIITKIWYFDINNKRFEEHFTIVTDLSALSLAGYSGKFSILKAKR